MQSLTKKVLLLASTASFVMVAAACDDDNSRPITGTRTDTVTVTIRDTVRIGDTSLVFNQIERLGNPLVSEVTLEKRVHGLHNSTNPSTDVANFRADIIRFITTVAGRSNGTASAIADILLPDMLLVYPNRATGVTAASADTSQIVGWLTWALAPGTGYGGRKLDNDDAVDKGLMAIFGPLLDPNNVSPGLASDNVADPIAEPNTFPYLAAP